MISRLIVLSLAVLLASTTCLATTYLGSLIYDLATGSLGGRIMAVIVTLAFIGLVTLFGLIDHRSVLDD
jgi:hypothetical protein